MKRHGQPGRGRLDAISVGLAHAVPSADGMSSHAHARRLEPPSAFDLALPLFVVGLLLAFTLVDLGVCKRALSGESNDVQFAEFYFGEPIPLVSSLKRALGPAVLLLVPKVVAEDVVPLCRGDGYCCHWLGVLALCDVGALATVVGSLLNPRKAVANEHFFDATDAADVARLYWVVFALGCGLGACLVARTWARAVEAEDR